MNSKGVLNIVLIGAKSSGKTIYLSTLWGKGLLADTDSDTKKYLQNTWSYIKENGQAEATSGMFKTLNFGYVHEEFGRLNFSIDDYDGTFTETISQKDDNTKEEREKLLNSVKKSEGCIFFLPFEKNSKRFKDFAQEIDAFIKLAHFSGHNKSPIPASIVITKWDDSDSFQQDNELAEAKAYIEQNEYLSRAVKLINDNFQNTTLIPISSFKNYGLIQPIDFSLEKTFEQWYKRANELFEEKNYEKLIKYFALRFEDMKFNEKYNFLEIYEKTQIEYVKDITKELQNKTSLLEQREYLDSNAIYFTQSKLLEPLYESVNKKEYQQKSKRNKSIILATLTSSILLFAGVEYYNKLTINEKYMTLVDEYSKGSNYLALKDEINFFLDTYQNSNILYAISDLPLKRDEIIHIKNELKSKNQSTIDKKIEIINNEKNITENEKYNKLKILLEQSSDEVQKTNLEQKTQEIEEKRRYLESVINQINNAEEREEIFQIIRNFKNSTFPKNIVNQVATKMKELDEESFQTSKGKELLSNLKIKITKESLVDFIDNDVERFLDLKEKYRKLLEKIDDVEQDVEQSEKELAEIDYSNLNSFEIFEQSKVFKALQKKMSDICKNFWDNKPTNKFNLPKNKTYLANIDKLYNFKIESIVFYYTPTSEQKTEFKKFKKDYEKIVKLKNQGIDLIFVTIKGSNGNSLHFYEGLTGAGREGDNIIIEGFNNTTLSYENNTYECEEINNKAILRFSTKISLKSDESYNIEIIEKNLIKDFKLSAKKPIKFTLEDLYNLSNSKKVIKSFDDGKIKLVFQKEL